MENAVILVGMGRLLKKAFKKFMKITMDSQIDSNIQWIRGEGNVDPYHLSGSDSPSMNVGNITFNGSNFVAWNRSIQMALSAKLKLGFVDGTIVKPELNSPNFVKWSCCDNMVRCWLLNSMTNELAQSFIYAESARELWNEIQEQYGQTNGLSIFKLQHELSNIKQGNQSVTCYYNRLKQCWDGLQSVNAYLTCTRGKVEYCTCRLQDRLIEFESQCKLMQFLMGLSEVYESVRNQILSLDPLPTVGRAFYLVLQVEKQHQVTSNITSDIDMSVFNVSRGYSFGKPNVGDRKDMRRSKVKCKNCLQEGDSTEQCFELIGCPDWYKGKKNNKEAAGKINMVTNHITKGFDSPFDHSLTKENSEKSMQVDQNLLQAMCKEVLKMMQSKQGACVNPSTSTRIMNFAASTSSEE